MEFGRCDVAAVVGAVTVAVFEESAVCAVSPLSVVSFAEFKSKLPSNASTSVSLSNDLNWDEAVVAVDSSNSRPWTVKNNYEDNRFEYQRNCLQH